MLRSYLVLFLTLTPSIVAAADNATVAVNVLRQELDHRRQEAQRLRGEVDTLRSEIRRLRSITPPVFVDVSASAGLVDTGVVLQEGWDYRVVWLGGRWRLGPDEPWLGPEGEGAEWGDREPGKPTSLIKVAPHGAVVHVVQGRASRLDRTALLQEKTGPLRIGVNEGTRVGADGRHPLDDNEGSMRFLIVAVPKSASP